MWSFCRKFFELRNNLIYVNHFIVLCLPNAEDQPDRDIKYLRAGDLANILCHGLGCIHFSEADVNSCG